VKFLLDTCLISELVKKEPNAAVLRWLDECDEQTLFLSVLTLGELQKGSAGFPQVTGKTIFKHGSSMISSSDSRGASLISIWKWRLPGGNFRE
jgi:hypothetical protein